ncbi:MAG TPA: hypothetical protein EYP78_00490 [Candidatus Omnitrophica bacterium]|nr:hypothetical protein [Candidatus Omnitrophota bacterium]
MIGRKKVEEWIELIQKRDTNLISHLESIYGQNDTLIDERLDTLSQIAMKFRRIYGSEREISFVRAPGRLNTLGMHVDHRGGFVNPIAINREILLCYSARNDTFVQVHNMDASYGKRRFNITEELPFEEVTTVKDWLTWTQQQTNKRRELGVDQDWVNKLKSTPVYLQVKYPQRNLLGLDSILNSNIPAGMGLSSSSAIVVGMMEALTDINHISLTDDEFVNYCGISEWFVGTRGGSGDHAAIKFGRLGMITHMKTLPELTIKSYLPFPEGYQMIVFNSGITADKSGSARQKFNEKTATYEIGEIYIREYLQRHYGGIFRKIVREYSKEGKKRFHLADVIEQLSQSQIYELIQSLPERMSREKLLAQLPEYQDFLREQFATHLEPEEGYEIRSVLTYGIAECERSRMLEEVTREGNIKLFGELMNVSHDGDRVSFKSPEQRKRKSVINTNQPLYLQPGGYNCSIPEIDDMVDLALEAGAEGAQISGAGLGGSMMVLVKADKFNHVREVLRSKYYLPRKIKEDFIVVSPMQGAGQL